MIDIRSTFPPLPFNSDRIIRIIEAALKASNPEDGIGNHIKRKGNILEAGGKKYNLDYFDRVILIGAGKAAFPMAKQTVAILNTTITGGAIVVKHLPAGIPAGLDRGIEVLKGDHPVPGSSSLVSTRSIIQHIEKAGEKDLVVFLLSGGASSLFTQPREGISLADLQKLTGLLLSSGADIEEINALRKHLDVVKGGGLARLVAPAEMLVLVLSDVIGNSLDVIGSGPSSGDASTYADCLKVLEKYSLTDRTPESIFSALQAGDKGRLPETLRPDDPLLQHVHHVIVGSLDQSALAARAAASDLGFTTQILTTAMTGEARERGRELGQLLATRKNEEKTPFCLIAGGETTVTIRGKGIGGRNLELALAAVEILTDVPGAALVTLATDGDDGISGAAGAVVTGETMARAEELGIHPRDFLKNNDSFTFFQKVGGLLVTGPTGTNVNDLVFLIGCS